MKRKTKMMLKFIFQALVMGVCAALGLYETIVIGILVYTLIT